MIDEPLILLAEAFGQDFEPESVSADPAKDSATAPDAVVSLPPFGLGPAQAL